MWSIVSNVMLSWIWLIKDRNRSLLLVTFPDCRLPSDRKRVINIDNRFTRHFPFNTFTIEKGLELITGYGRLIHKQLERLAVSEKYGFETIFGFTDSIFIRNAKSVESICSFIAECNMKFGIVLEHKEERTNS